jgi:hypothetical protein
MAQNATIKASIDSTQMWIGEQAHISIEVAAERSADLNLLPLDKYIMKGIEILEQSQPDTTDIGNNRILINYNYRITSFDEDLYAIPPFKAAVNGDTILSNELALKIISVPIDTAALQQVQDIREVIYDIKDVVKPPFVWKDYINYVLYPLLGIAVIALLVLAYIFFIKKKPVRDVIKKKEEPKLPPHIEALKKLDKIKAEKLWQQGRVKEYHSYISDTLRYYMERRFNIGAMEMTSSEILDQVRGVSDIDNVYDKLKQVLLVADLVKFAKYNPLPDENEVSLFNAYLFVNETKIDIVETPNANEINKTV